MTMAAQQEHFATSRMLQLACITTAVALWKRAWVEDEEDKNSYNNTQDTTTVDPEEAYILQQLSTLQLLPQQQQQQQYQQPLVTRHDLFQYLQHYWFPSNPTLACIFLSQLIGEMSGKSSVSYRMPMEFHKHAHASFEKHSLLLTLQIARQGLAGVMNSIIHQQQQASAELQQSPSSSHQQQQTLGVVIVPLHSVAIVQLVLDVLGWEFGLMAWSTSSVGASASMTRTLLRPPIEWKEYLAQPDFVGAIFHLHRVIWQQQQQNEQLAYLARQLLLQLASLSGPMFLDAAMKKQFASHLLDGTLSLLQSPGIMQEETPLLVDTLQIIARIIQNFRLTTLIELQPTLVPLLQGLTTAGSKILHDQVQDCQQAGGDLDSMEFYDWRESVIEIVIDCGVTLCGDPWLLYTGTDETRQQAQESLSHVLGPLYEGFVRCRTKMAALEEHYQVSRDEDLDELQEEILESSLEEELTAVSTLGRLNLSAALACMSSLFGETMPRLQSLWEGSGEVTAEIAALLEEARLLTLYVCHLLTDDNKGESAAIPDAIVMACQRNPHLTLEIAGAVEALMTFADTQAHKIASNPANLRLSPMLSRSFLWFLQRWAPAYVYPSDCGESSRTNSVLQEWSTPEKAQHVVNFCASLCLHYQCYWPQEKVLQEYAGKLLMSLAEKAGPVRKAFVLSPPFHQMVRFHCLTASMRHIASHDEFDATIKAKVPQDHLSSLNMVWGYQRLPYDDKARILTVILVACSDQSDDASNSMITDSMKVIHDGFAALVVALTSNQIGHDDIHAKEMTSLCMEMFCGIAHASGMWDPERIPQFVTPFLPQIAGLMAFYGKDLGVSETLLRFFRDYTEQFIVLLNREQCLALFSAVADALKSYSENHMHNRVIHRKSNAEASADEEQAYSDILCALQLLVNLGAKEFIDACSVDEGVSSSQVTDMIFYGLQQILPLMSEGLLQFPSLCTMFFELVFYMMDTYPEKVSALPYDLFNAMIESILFGMRYHDTHVAKCSLHALASIPKEHLQTPQILAPHLAQHPDVFDKCIQRLLTEVIFQNVVVDRLEPAGTALLYLVAVDVNSFGNIVHQLSSQISDERQRYRLQAAFHKLIQPELLDKLAQGGYEGRMVRSRFKSLFEEFVNDVHSFLVMR